VIAYPGRETLPQTKRGVRLAQGANSARVLRSRVELVRRIEPITPRYG
jgi:hypothetical protein